MKNININKNSNQSGRKERMECSADTKLFFDDVYKSGTRGKKQQVDVLQYGRSMIEMLGVLAIVGVLSVGGIAGYSKAMEKFKINKTADQISQIVTNIRTLYAQQTTYEGLNTANAIKMGVTPDELGTGTTLTNAFAGPLYIGTSNRLSSSSDDAFYIAAVKIPKEACVTLATLDWGSSYSSGLISVSASFSGVFNPTYAMDDCVSSSTSSNEFVVMERCAKDGPMPVAHAAQACNCTEEGCSVIWKFY